MYKKEYYLSIYLIFTSFCLNILGYIHGVSEIRYITFLLLNIFFLVYYRAITKISVKSELLLIVIYQTYLVIATILNGYSIYNCQSAIQMLFSIWLANYIISIDLKMFLKGTVDICKLVLPANLICCVLFKNGIVSASNGIGIYLLGNKNTMGMTIIALSIFNIMYDKLSADRKTTIKFNLICGGITILLTWSATAIIALAIITVYYLFSNSSFVKRTINSISIKQITIIDILLFLGLCVFNIQEYFSLLIQNVLHKEATLSARTLIWQTAQKAVQSKLIFGYGFYDSKLLENAYFIPANSHSFFMEILLTGGIIGSIIMLFLLFRFSKNVSNSSNTLSAVIKVAYIVLLIEGLVESTNLSLYFYLILIISDKLKNTKLPNI